MKKINTYSAQYKFISEQPKQNHPIPPNPNSMPNKRKLTKHLQEFIKNISAIGFK